jgi:hypothetical protein
MWHAFLILVFLIKALFIYAEKIPVIWQSHGGDYIWDSDWVREVLSELPIVEIFDGNFEKIQDKAIIIAYGHEQFESYINKYIEKGYQFGVINLADETYSHTTSYYDKANFVIRPYWHKKFLNLKNVYTIPLGYEGGFWKNGKPTQVKNILRRFYTWSFAGQINKSTRISMITNMKSIPHHFIHEIGSFADPNSLSQEKYRNLMLNSIFIPCPKGWVNLESFRVWEALECGCIPIVEKTPFDYFAKAYGPYPFLAVSSWNEAPKLINDLLTNPKQLEELQNNCLTWWKEYKKNMKGEIKKIVDEAFN